MDKGDRRNCLESIFKFSSEIHQKRSWPLVGYSFGSTENCFSTSTLKGFSLYKTVGQCIERETILYNFGC